MPARFNAGPCGLLAHPMRACIWCGPLDRNAHVAPMRCTARAGFHWSHKLSRTCAVAPRVTLPGRGGPRPSRQRYCVRARSVLEVGGRRAFDFTFGSYSALRRPPGMLRAACADRGIGPCDHGPSQESSLLIIGVCVSDWRKGGHCYETSSLATARLKGSAGAASRYPEVPCPRV